MNSKRVLLLVCLMSVVVVIGYSVFTDSESEAGDEQSKAEPEQQKDRPFASRAHRDAEHQTDDSTRVRQLERELAQKEVQIAALTAATATAKHVAEDDNLNAEPGGAAAQTMTILNERLAQQAARNGSDSQLATDVAAALYGNLKRSTTVREVVCADTICRVALTDENVDELENSVVTFSDALTKTAGGMSVIDNGTGKKILYIGKTHTDIARSADPSESPEDMP